MIRKVEIYSGPNCGPCQSAKKYFKEHNIEFIEYNVAQEPERAVELLELSGTQSIPVIVIDGKVIKGFKKDEIAQELGIVTV
jgi:glutaredoxin-like YruB-family protein